MFSLSEGSHFITAGTSFSASEQTPPPEIMMTQYPQPSQPQNPQDDAFAFGHDLLSIFDDQSTTTQFLSLDTICPSTGTVTQMFPVNIQQLVPTTLTDEMQSILSQLPSNVLIEQIEYDPNLFYFVENLGQNVDDEGQQVAIKQEDIKQEDLNQEDIKEEDTEDLPPVKRQRTDRVFETPSQPIPIPTTTIFTLSTRSTSSILLENGVELVRHELEQHERTEYALTEQPPQLRVQLPGGNFVKRIEVPDPAGYRFECHFEGCGKRFLFRSDSTRHILSHSGEKPIKCTWEGCARTFSQHGHMAEHLRTHTRERPFVCELCGANFAQKSSMGHHLRAHSTERTFVCRAEGCAKTYKHHADLRKHQRTQNHL